MQVILQYFDFFEQEAEYQHCFWNTKMIKIESTSSSFKISNITFWQTNVLQDGAAEINQNYILVQSNNASW